MVDWFVGCLVGLTYTRHDRPRHFLCVLDANLCACVCQGQGSRECCTDTPSRRKKDFFASNANITIRLISVFHCYCFEQCMLKYLHKFVGIYCQNGRYTTARTNFFSGEF